MVDTTITLTAPGARVQDANGIWRTSGDTAREIFAQVESVRRGEFFAAGEAGYRPEYVFTVFAAEYRGEPTLEYDGKRYAIYRTYHVPGTDYLELYAQREGGVNDGSHGN